MQTGMTTIDIWEKIPMTKSTREMKMELCYGKRGNHSQGQVGRPHPLLNHETCEKMNKTEP